MQALFTSIAALWPRIPKAVRFIVMLALCVAALSFGATAAFLAWRSGHIAQVLGTTAQTTDIVQQTATIRAIADSIAQGAAEQATQQLSGEMYAYMAQERKQAEDTILRPMLQLMYGLDRRLQRIEKAQKLTDDRVSALPVEFDAKLRRIVEDTPPPTTEILLKEVLEHVQKQSERLDRIEKQRGSKAKF